MRIRRKYWPVPVLAVIGILFALFHYYAGSPDPRTESSLELSPPPAPDAPAENAAPAAATKPTEKTKLTIDQIAAIRTEMKMSLIVLQGAEKSFFKEFRRYTTDLAQLGYFPETKAVNFKAGFLREYSPDAAQPGEDPRRLTLDDIRSNPENPSQIFFQYAPYAESVNLADAARFCRNGCSANDKHFEIVVATNLDDDPDLDVWTITDEKVLTQVNSDLVETR